MTGDNTKFKGGYTLVEMLVAIAIFSIAFVAVTTIFASFMTLQLRTAAAQRLLNEANYLFESVAREIRNNAIDYDCPYTTYGTSDDYICLQSIDGKVEHIRFAGGDVSICKANTSTDCAAGSTYWASLVPSFMTVTSMRFAVYPTVSPIGRDVLPDQVYHPLTQLFLSVQAGKGKSLQKYDFQTAVSSRYYKY